MLLSVGEREREYATLLMWREMYRFSLRTQKLMPLIERITQDLHRKSGSIFFLSSFGVTRSQ